MMNYDEFLACCRDFLETSENLKDRWEAVNDFDSSNYKYYLVKRQPVPISLNKTGSDFEKVRANLSLEKKNVAEVLQSLEDLNISEDHRFSAPAESYIWTFEYHVIFSLAYNVPLLYFNAWDESGNLILLEDIWKFITSCDHSISNYKSQWETVTHSHHPIQGGPFYFFHPCHTSDVMKYVRESSNWIHSYIPSWLGIYGSLIGLTIHLDYFRVP